MNLTTSSNYKVRQAAFRRIAEATHPAAPRAPKKLSARAVHRMLVREAKSAAPGPKLDKPRNHKQHTHTLRDDLGAFTLTGRNYPLYGREPWNLGVVVGWAKGRRAWVAGVSSRRTSKLDPQFL